MRKGALILCGGKSSRMGRDKATLPFGSEVMLQRVVRLTSEAVPLDEIAVVAAPNQALPDLPAQVMIVRDSEEYRGPLRGLTTGLSALDNQVDAVFVTACDVPLLEPAFINRLFELLGDFEIAVPYDGQYHYPLAAVYRPSVLQHAQRLLDSQRSRPRFLFDEVPTREVPVDDMRIVDPALSTLVNLNREQDYRDALAAAGFSESM